MFNFKRNRTLSWLAGVAALGLCLMGLTMDPAHFFAAYVEGYLFWVGITLGSLGMWMIHNLVGGRWGNDPVAKIIRTVSKTLPLMTVLFIPVLMGMSYLYPWARPDAIHNHELQQKAWWLNSPFFIGRAIFYFVVWNLFAILVQRMSKNEPLIPGSPPKRRLQNLSAAGLLIFGITISFAMFDWVMSMEPMYYSTMFGVILIVGFLGSAFAFSTLLSLNLTGGRHSQLDKGQLHDLGNLLLMSVMLWAYTSFSQYLITFAGQLPEEIVWYNVRFVGGWQIVGLTLLGFNFVVPFFLLLFRRVKKSAMPLMILTSLLLLDRIVDLIWMIGPTHSPKALSLHWMDIVAPIGIGGIWLGTMLLMLERGFPQMAPVGVPQDRV